MQLFIMRHGEAHPNAIDDKSRSLTELGTQQAEMAGHWLRQLCGQIDLALVSPYQRTQQTFTGLNHSSLVVEQQLAKELIPSAEPEQICDYLDFLSTQGQSLQSVLLVSHMPLVGYLLYHLTGESRAFATGNIAQLEWQGSQQKAQLLGFFQASAP